MFTWIIHAKRSSTDGLDFQQIAHQKAKMFTHFVSDQFDSHQSEFYCELSKDIYFDSVRYFSPFFERKNFPTL